MWNLDVDGVDGMDGMEWCGYDRVLALVHLEIRSVTIL